MTNLTPFTSPEEVLAAIKPVTDRVHLGLHHLLPSTRTYFESKRFPVHKSLHAHLTRFELKQHLLAQQISASDEEEFDSEPFSVRVLPAAAL